MRLTLPVLSEGDAVTLFARTAGREPEQAAEVARLCGGLPLAIRLTASHLRSGAVTTVAQLLDLLDERGQGSGRADDLIHRIRAIFDLSYRQLTHEERRFFRYLGISPLGSVTTSSAAVVRGCSEAEAEAALGTLSSHHLLEEVSPGRHSFHDLIRDFAAARFASEDLDTEARFAGSRLADYYMIAVRRALDAPHDHDAREWLQAEWGNVRRVAQYCDRHEMKRQCADLVHVLSEFLEADGHWDEALTAQVMALQACRDLDDLPRIARAAFKLSLTSLRIGRTEEALRQATEAATMFGTLGDKRGQAAALDRLGIIHRNTARFREALAYHREAIDIYREVDDRKGLAKTLTHAGAALGELGRIDEEMRDLSEALAIYREIRDLRGEAITLNTIGTAQYRQGYHRDAERSYGASLDIFRKIGERQSVALIDQNLAQLQQYKGNYPAAITLYREVLATYRDIGDIRHQAYALMDLGSAYNDMDRFDDALTHYEKAVSLGETVGDHYASARALCGIAEAHFGAGRLSAALDGYERAVRLSGEIESLYLKAKALSGMGEIALQTRGRDAARIILREAHDIFAQLGVPEAATIEIRLQALDERDPGIDDP